MSEQSSPAHPGDDLDPTALQHGGDAGGDERHDPLRDDRFAEPEGYVGESFPGYSPTQRQANSLQVSDDAEANEQSEQLSEGRLPKEAVHTRLVLAATALGVLAVATFALGTFTGSYWVGLIPLLFLPAIIVFMVSNARRPPS